jgi:aminoglycoside phosphotransferase (APT) family kinase protein
MRLTATAAAALIGAQFSDLAPSRVHLLGEGCDSIAFDVNDMWVFRFPKNADVARQLEREWTMLPMLVRRLPVAIPEFRFRGAPTDAYPHAFAGYAKLPGRPSLGLPPDVIRIPKLGAALGSFLSALHAFPVADAERAGVPRERLADVVLEVKDDALDDLSRVRAVAPEAPLEQWQRFINAGVELPETSREALLHNDLAAEHVLFDPADGRITGVIDWSDMAIGDPLVDFAGLFHWGGEPLVRSALSRYSGSLSEAQLRCARYLGACRGAMDVAFGLARNRPEYVRAGLAALRLCTGL